MKTLRMALVAASLCLVPFGTASAAKLTTAQKCEISFTKMSQIANKHYVKGYLRGCKKGPDPKFDAKLQSKVDKAASKFASLLAKNADGGNSCDPDDNYALYLLPGAWFLGFPTQDAQQYCDGVPSN